MKWLNLLKNHLVVMQYFKIWRSKCQITAHVFVCYALQGDCQNTSATQYSCQLWIVANPLGWIIRNCEEHWNEKPNSGVSSGMKSFDFYFGVSLGEINHSNNFSKHFNQPVCHQQRGRYDYLYAEFHTHRWEFYALLKINQTEGKWP